MRAPHRRTQCPTLAHRHARPHVTAQKRTVAPDLSFAGESCARMRTSKKGTLERKLSAAERQELAEIIAQAKKLEDLVPSRRSFVIGTTNYLLSAFFLGAFPGHYCVYPRTSLSVLSRMQKNPKSRTPSLCTPQAYCILLSAGSYSSFTSSRRYTMSFVLDLSLYRRPLANVNALHR